MSAGGRGGASPGIIEVSISALAHYPDAETCRPGRAAPRLASVDFRFSELHFCIDPRTIRHTIMISLFHHHEFRYWLLSLSDYISHVQQGQSKLDKISQHPDYCMDVLTHRNHSFVRSASPIAAPIDAPHALAPCLRLRRSLNGCWQARCPSFFRHQLLSLRLLCRPSSIFEICGLQHLRYGIALILEKVLAGDSSRLLKVLTI